MQISAEVLKDIKNDIIAIINNAFLVKEMIRTKVATQWDEFQLELSIVSWEDPVSKDTRVTIETSVCPVIPDSLFYGDPWIIDNRSHTYLKSDGLDWLPEFSDVLSDTVIYQLTSIDWK